MVRKIIKYQGTAIEGNYYIMNDISIQAIRNLIGIGVDSPRRHVFFTYHETKIHFLDSHRSLVRRDFFHVKPKRFRFLRHEHVLRACAGTPHYRSLRKFDLSGP